MLNALLQFGAKLAVPFHLYKKLTSIGGYIRKCLLTCSVLTAVESDSEYNVYFKKYEHMRSCDIS